VHAVIVIETVLGNTGDPVWAERLSAAAIDLLEIDQREAQKSRFRKHTAAGVEVAVSVDRGTYLRDGDVLLWDGRARTALVARIQLSDVMVVDLEDLLQSPPEVALRICVELGHALGNQHWPAVVKEVQVYIPLTVDRKVMGSVMDTHRLEGVRYRFVSGREVIPHLAPHEARRLFGGTDPVQPHSHTHTHHAHAEGGAEVDHVQAHPHVHVSAHPKTSHARDRTEK
jgi:urease accessory protein